MTDPATKAEWLQSLRQQPESRAYGLTVFPLAGYLLAVLFLWLLVGCTPEKPVDLTYDYLRGAVKVLKGQKPDGKPGEMVGFCSGVVLDEHTILTAAHCDVTERFKTSIYVNGYRTFVVKKDEKRDLMLLHVPSGMACPCVGVRQIQPKRDSEVVAVGYPLDVGQVLTEGRYEGPSTRQPDDVQGLILFTASVTWGDSGGGVFQKTPLGWALVGIISRGKVAEIGFAGVIVQHLNFAAGAESIAEFLKGDA